MRKQARKLWLGDWHSDDEQAHPRSDTAPPDAGDTVVITQEDDEDTRAGGRRGARRGLAGLAAVALLCALGLVLLASGNESNPSTERTQVEPPETQSPQAQPEAPSPSGPQSAPSQGFGGPSISTANAAKAARAALLQYPGTLERVTAGPGGSGYIVHVIQPDGNEVHVLVDEEFNVRGSDAGNGRQSRPGTPQ